MNLNESISPIYMKNTVLILLSISFFSSCFYDSEENLYPGNICNSTNMSYQNDILPIIQTNCYVCHSAASNLGNVTLEGHGNLLEYVNNGRLLGAIKHIVPYKPMPESQPKLSACNIEKIDQWVLDGAKNN